LESDSKLNEKAWFIRWPFNLESDSKSNGKAEFVKWPFTLESDSKVNGLYFSSKNTEKFPCLPNISIMPKKN